MQTGNFASYLEILYTDTLTVRSQEVVTNDDGTRDNRVSDVVKAQAKCRVSYKKIDAPYELDTAGEPVVFELKVICGPAVDIKAGDLLEITRFEPEEGIVTFGGLAGQPAKYGTHQEVILIHKRRA